MRVLVLAGGSPATVFALAPLATAARLRGHDVVVATTAEVAPFAVSTGLPAVTVTDETMRRFMFADRAGESLSLPSSPSERLLFNGRGFGRMAAGSLSGLRELTRDFPVDLIVGGSLCYAAPLLAAEIGVPFVRHTWDLGEPPEMDLGAAEELRPELDALGLGAIPDTDLWVDICPPSLRGPVSGPRQNMRFVPFNEQRPLEPGTYRRGERPRVCVTAGSRVSHEDEVEYLAALLTSINPLDVDIAVAAPEPVALALRATAPRVRAGWFPLDVLLSTCDAMVHHGGGQSALTALNAAVPQLLIPNIPKMLAPCVRIAEAGAAIVLEDGGTPGHIGAAVGELLEARPYLSAARAVRYEIGAQPAPPDVVASLEDLVGARR